MFASTISITVATGVTLVLQRVNQDNYGSEYQFSDATQSVSMKIRHSTDSVDGDGITMKRHNVFFERIIFPTATTLLKKYSFTATLRHDVFGDPGLAATTADGVSDWLISGTVLADLAAGVN